MSTVKGCYPVLWRIFNTVEGNQKHCGDYTKGVFGAPHSTDTVYPSKH